MRTWTQLAAQTVLYLCHFLRAGLHGVNQPVYMKCFCPIQSIWGIFQCDQVNEDIEVVHTESEGSPTTGAAKVKSLGLSAVNKQGNLTFNESIDYRLL